MSLKQIIRAPASSQLVVHLSLPAGRLSHVRPPASVNTTLLHQAGHSAKGPLALALRSPGPGMASPQVDAPSLGVSGSSVFPCFSRCGWRAKLHWLKKEHLTLGGTCAVFFCRASTGCLRFFDHACPSVLGIGKELFNGSAVRLRALLVTSGGRLLRVPRHRSFFALNCPSLSLGMAHGAGTTSPLCLWHRSQLSPLHFAHPCSCLDMSK